MEAEQAYLAALATVDTVVLQGDTLLLTGPATELVFGPNEPAPLDEFLDRIWLLESYTTGDETFEAAPADLVLNSDGTVEATTGCRSVTGEYVVAGGQVT